MDLVAIARIKRLIGKYGEDFLRNFLCQSEIDLCVKKTRNDKSNSDLGFDLCSNPSKSHDITHFNIERIAGFYAAKEAISKALCCGISKNLTFKDIKLSKDSHGAPKAKLTKRTKKYFKVKKIYLSITHDKDRIRGVKNTEYCQSQGFAIAIALIKR